MSFTVWNLSENQADCFLIVLEIDKKGNDEEGKDKKEKVTILVDGNSEKCNYVQLRNEIQTRCEKLDYIVVSHVDDDHLGGVIKMLEESNWDGVKDTIIFYNHVAQRVINYRQAVRFEELIKGRTVLSSYKSDLYPLERGPLNILSENNRKLCMDIEKNKKTKAYLTLIKPSGANLQKVQADCKRVLKNEKKENYKLINRNSLVFLLEFEGKKAIFTGDANWNQIEKTLKQVLGEKKYVMDLIKIPHHGAALNNKQLVAYSVEHKTRYFIVTGSEQWDQKHPNKELVQEIETKCSDAEIYTLIRNLTGAKVKVERECKIEK